MKLGGYILDESSGRLRVPDHVNDLLLLITLILQALILPSVSTLPKSCSQCCARTEQPSHRCSDSTTHYTAISTYAATTSKPFSPRSRNASTNAHVAYLHASQQPRT